MSLFVRHAQQPPPAFTICIDYFHDAPSRRRQALLITISCEPASFVIVSLFIIRSLISKVKQD